MAFPIPFVPHDVLDRAWWQRVAQLPAHRQEIQEIMALAAAASDHPPVPRASDFLAARRTNNRGILDRHWREDRRTLTALAIRRLVVGITDGDPDDRLLDWLFALLHEPTWVVSAHLPDRDLPHAAKPSLDLAACEMAAQMAEIRETLKPWMDRVSQTLADSIVHEIDRRVLTPLVDGPAPWWMRSDPPQTNNWSGVCAGAVLAACESLAAQGHPRPEARAIAMDTLRRFFDAGFTPGGECDEGIGYWNYGVGFACVGLSRLSPGELRSAFDMDRLGRIADYPRLAHLFGDCFFTGNDGSLRSSPQPHFLAWLAEVTGNAWLTDWARQSEPGHEGGKWHISQVLRLLAVEHDKKPSAAMAATSPADPARYLADQQVLLVRRVTSAGDLVACLSGGTNAERHNHNDLGHYLVCLDGQVIVPDLGRPHYTTDFFGPRRYTYISAGSLGHNCPVVNGREQRAGRDAAGRVLEVSLDPPRLALELASAYPPEAKLESWRRSMETEPAGVVVSDRLAAPAESPITLVTWSQVSPRPQGEASFALGRLKMQVQPPPAEVVIVPLRAGDALLVDYPAETTLWRIEMRYQVPATGVLEVETRFGA